MSFNKAPKCKYVFKASSTHHREIVDMLWGAANASRVMLWGDAFASGMISFAFIHNALNSTDIVTKKWGYNQVKNKLKTLVFWKGNNEDLGNDG